MSPEVIEKPADFDEFWEGVNRELNRYHARPVLNPLPRHSTSHFSVYWVGLTSIGPYRIGGYLSVPTGAGPFPALLQTPRYGSVNHVPHFNDRLRYVVLTLMHRGQRLADEPFAAAYPGLLTTGIEDARSYIYRGIVADCLRGAEFLMDQAEVDKGRTAVVGDDLAMITAALRPSFSIVQVSGVAVQRDALLLYRLIEAAERTSSYPLEEANDYLRSHPLQKSRIQKTVSYFDPVHHVPQLTSLTLLDVNESGRTGGPEWVQPLSDAFGGTLEYYLLTHKGGTDQDHHDAWLASHLGAEPMSSFERDLRR